MRRLKVCVVTAARSEYGLLRWVMKEIADSRDMALQLIVTGAHLSSEYGLTWKEIEADGFAIDARVDMGLASDDAVSLVRSMGRCSIGIADALETLRPDWLMVLGDRYELLPICSAALVMRIPIAHISGGDITLGAIDDQIRNAVSKMASLHFPGTEKSAERLVSMGEEPERVYAVGEPGLDNIRRLPRMSREELAADLGLNPGKKWALFAYHPETKLSSSENMKTLRAALNAVLGIQDMISVATYANADHGGQKINAYLESMAEKVPEKLKVQKSLGQRRFVSFMAECVLMAGNSSSGIVEAPLFGIPVLNIGERQKGRHLCTNVHSCDSSPRAIEETLSMLERAGFPKADPDHYYGDGQSAERIVGIFREKAPLLGCK
ncbi:MAG: UDP-N-acetylglucosamine 2-epimerase [Spirochaetia bacterium]|jgi:UDP-N-acetylglucosamine 2-epimerase (non-hydrolysing)|nr:UDP-N-acetylglucosamine 2-epimerase [Spirochaetia bacterium]